MGKTTGQVAGFFCPITGQPLKNLDGVVAGLASDGGNYSQAGILLWQQRAKGIFVRSRLNPSQVLVSDSRGVPLLVANNNLMQGFRDYEELKFNYFCYDLVRRGNGQLLTCYFLGLYSAATALYEHVVAQALCLAIARKENRREVTGVETKYKLLQTQLTPFLKQGLSFPEQHLPVLKVTRKAILEAVFQGIGDYQAKTRKDPRELKELKVLCQELMSTVVLKDLVDALSSYFEKKESSFFSRRTETKLKPCDEFIIRSLQRSGLLAIFLNTPGYSPNLNTQEEIIKEIDKLRRALKNLSTWAFNYPPYEPASKSWMLDPITTQPLIPNAHGVSLRDGCTYNLASLSGEQVSFPNNALFTIIEAYRSLQQQVQKELNFFSDVEIQKKTEKIISFCAQLVSLIDELVAAKVQNNMQLCRESASSVPSYLYEEVRLPSLAALENAVKRKFPLGKVLLAVGGAVTQYFAESSSSSRDEYHGWSGQRRAKNLAVEVMMSGNIRQLKQVLSSHLAGNNQVWFLDQRRLNAFSLDTILCEYLEAVISSNNDSLTSYSIEERVENLQRTFALS